MTGDAIPLRAYRVAPRKPWLRVEADSLVFRLPSWFGGTTFAVPLSSVAVVDEVAAGALGDEEDDVVFAEPLAVPYLYTTGPGTPPTLRVLFAEPVRLPPFRRLVRSQAAALAPKRPARGARPAGRYLDGVLLRAVDGRAAVEALVAAGAERVDDPLAWLAARREVVSDPARIAEMAEEDKLFRTAGGVAIGVGAAGLAALVLSRWLGAAWAIAGMAGTAAGLGGHTLLAYASERHWLRRDPGQP